MDKETIIRNFSRHAHLYDKYADIQKKSALELLGQIKENNFDNILEIGCGTGNYTLLLRGRFKVAKIKAVDISSRMIEVAREKFNGSDIEFIIADAEKLNLKENFGLITSNACFQWFADLEKALLMYRGLLKKQGIISFSIFGSHTFWELNASLKCLFPNKDIVADSFLVKDKIKKLLQNNFKKTKIKEISYQERYDGLRDLLRKIKYTGVRGNGLGSKILFDHRHFKKLEEVYLNRFKEVRATSQIFFCQVSV
ncbi:MAG: malonyl-ACP O-methyltransferase BioC [Candidatus Omnitrophica bacterium]|nr:malonyl-ACP O-methyltransferase BioC [Candidatus Omnitrophota bacterium]MBI5144816.1 malonyl-ACP O-methyltransferase BioC [Candidatus Omnitrophota bacterium]